MLGLASTRWLLRSRGRVSHVRCLSHNINYVPEEIEAKWQRKWAEERIARGKNTPDLDSRKINYTLTMFPYPSGTLHMGHVRVYAMSDCMARYYKLKGQNVVHPMGWDAFGLPAENAAIDRGLSPAEWTRVNIDQMRDQMIAMGFSFDWDRELATCDPEYYKWTQWIFVKMYKKKLAYQKAALVNWDPVDQTVLANEQVDNDGKSWRSGAVVEKKEMTQWFLRITDYAQELLEGLEDLNWPSQVKAMQQHWIGRSDGVTLEFPIVDANGNPPTSNPKATVKVFTTKVETVFGASFIALAPEHELVKASCDLFEQESSSKSCERREGIDKYVQKVCNMSSTTRKTGAGTEADTSNGLDLKICVRNPFSGKVVPVYACEYVFSDYGTGAVMGVPAHDQRDQVFAEKHGLEIVPVYSGNDTDPKEAGRTVLIESGEFSGMSVQEGRAAITTKAEAMSVGEHSVQYKIRDWSISRQRFWGAPIPIIHCPTCEAVPVPESDLPVRLPEGVKLTGRGGSPLQNAKEWLHTNCPRCNGPAVRDTNTMDTFVDSSWYFIRYLDSQNQNEIISRGKATGLPVNLYIGGIEHAIMHLLYSRFVTKFLRDEGAIDCSEPFTELLTQGMVHGRTFTDPETGRCLKPDEIDLNDTQNPTIKSTGSKPIETYEKMSKSKFNGVDPGQAASQHGVDTLRLHMLFKAPPDFVLDWDTQSIQGSRRWLTRVWGLVNELLDCQILTDDGYCGSQIDHESRRMLHSTIQAVETALESHSFNSAVGKLMGFTNDIRLHRERGMSTVVFQDCIEMLAIMSYPMTPHISSEIWELATQTPPSAMKWPVVDPKLLVPLERKVVIQINGRVRGTLQVDQNTSEEDIQTAVLKSDVAVKYNITQDTLKRVIVARKGELVNLVLAKK
eukprot:CFRG7641T1